MQDLNVGGEGIQTLRNLSWEIAIFLLRIANHAFRGRVRAIEKSRRHFDPDTIVSRF